MSSGRDLARWSQDRGLVVVQSKNKEMKLETFEFPSVTVLDMTFSTFDTIPELLKEAEKRNPRKGMKKFSDLFFNGGKLELQKDVKGTWKEAAFLYAKALMSSWSPKHEHKELVVGMIFEETLILKQ